MKNSKSALSMIELLVAIAVLGGALLPMWHLFYQSSRRVTIGENQTLIRNLSFAFSTQVRRFDPSLLPVSGSYQKLNFDEQGVYHLGGEASINKITLPDWNPEDLSLSFQIKRLTTLPRENRLAILKIEWARRNLSNLQFYVPTLVSHD